MDDPQLFKAKRAAGAAAADLIQQGMLVGIGSGSTVSFFIESLAARCQRGLKISAAAASEASMQQARRLGIPLIDDRTITQLDVTVDGADEIDDEKNMIKGGGGALLREKLLAEASKEMIVIVDETKPTARIGRKALPVEISPFLYPSILKRLQDAGCSGQLRLNAKQEPFTTDNYAYIVDLRYSSPILDPRVEHERLKQITGVVETGLFFHLAGRVLIGLRGGGVEVRT